MTLYTFVTVLLGLVLGSIGIVVLDFLRRLAYQAAVDVIELYSRWSQATIDAEASRVRLNLMELEAMSRLTENRLKLLGVQDEQ
jgi:hypothetical protein